MARNPRLAQLQTVPPPPPPLRHRRRRWVSCALLGLLLVLALVVPLRALLRAPRLRLGHVEVVGGRRLNAQEVLAVAGLRLGTPLLAMPLRPLVARLRAHPWIRDVVVQRRLPDTLRIEVQEHVPALLVARGSLQVADTYGALFKPYAAADGLVLPVVTGLGEASATTRGAAVMLAAVARAGAPAPAPVPPPRLQADLDVAIALQLRLNAAAAQLGSLDELHIDPALGWSAVLRHPTVAPAGVRVHLGHAPVSRVPAVMQAFALLAARGEQASVIWAGGDRHPDQIHVERLSAASERLPPPPAPRRRS